MLCPVQQACGGCPTLHLSREDEHERKRDRVEVALQQVGLTFPVPLPIAGTNRVQYRNRLRMRVIDGRATLFNRSKLDGCPALRPELWAAICELIELSDRRPELLESVDHLEIRVGDRDGEIGLSLACTSGDTGSMNCVTDDDQECSKAVRGALGNRWRVSDKTDPHQETLRYELNSTRLVSVPVNAFVQVNSEVNRMLVAYVAKESLRVGAATFLDLFAGAGNLCLPLVDAGLTGQAVERSRSAMMELAAQAERLTVIASDVETCLEDLQPADVVVVNPPRRGVGSRHELIAQLATTGIVLVSCDPKSLAFDLSQFMSCEFEIDRLATFDMFPGTEHIETVATLRRI